MAKSGTLFCALTVCAALATTSIATPAKAAASSVEVQKGKRKVLNGVGSGDPRSASPSCPPPMYDDFDRKNAGGGGGM